MPLTEHLEELRWRLVRSLVALGVGFGLAYLGIEPILDWITRPLFAVHPDKVRLIGTGVAEAFFTKLKVALIAGLFIASPFIFHQIWKFIAPGLHEEEKHYVRPFVLFSTFFFVAGAWFCYELVFPTAFGFFIEQYGSVQIEPYLRIGEYLSFTSRMLLAFAIVFELPVFTFFLARVGLVTHTMMITGFRYAVLGIFIVAAVLTPGPDVASQLLMAGPMLLLYILSIGVAWAFGKPRE
jgi:sec-independent protein translocase protein TatC